MDTIARVKELARERQLTMYQLAERCDVAYNTLKNAENRGGQLSVDTIERVCGGIGIPLSVFFEEAEEDRTCRE